MSVQPFLDDNFLLETDAARQLYHDYARDLPIVDYHCHLSPKEIADNRQFENITAMWLDGDHYKWRAMRTLGIDESFITGPADHFQKFQKWAYTVPYTMRNPLYHWTHLELKRYFDVSTILNPDTADLIYHQTNELINTPENRVRSILQKMNVEVVCTTDDPTDDLTHHKKIGDDEFDVTVLPAFRPDKALMVEKGKSFRKYIKSLGKAAGIKINDLSTLLAAFEQRMDYFHERGCRLSDHGLERIHAASFSLKIANKTLRRALKKKTLDPSDIEVYKSSVLFYLCRGYHKRGWTQQFHLGALRNNNSRMVKNLGPDTGFDSIGDWPQASALAKFFDNLDRRDNLAQTIIYNLNPNDNEVLATMIGNFNDGSKKGKMQFGSGWWFLDQKDGMEKQMNALSNMGLLSCFVGMLTDSRSFLSFPRHEYFRRILCNLFGNDIQKGELPNDISWIGKIISDICYHNARDYFDFWPAEISD